MSAKQLTWCWEEELASGLEGPREELAGLIGLVRGKGGLT